MQQASSFLKMRSLADCQLASAYSFLSCSPKFVDIWSIAELLPLPVYRVYMRF